MPPVCLVDICGSGACPGLSSEGSISWSWLSGTWLLARPRDADFHLSYHRIIQKLYRRRSATLLIWHDARNSEASPGHHSWNLFHSCFDVL